jgi:hypothetical protein
LDHSATLQKCPGDAAPAPIADIGWWALMSTRPSNPTAYKIKSLALRLFRAYFINEYCANLARRTWQACGNLSWGRE